jgi:hypothetical protein
MRLSAYVNQHGIDAFNFEDFLFVGQQVAKAPEPLILVGGQALETWGLAFNVLAPTGEQAPLTEDADWLGGKKDAIWLCERLGVENTELMIAGDFDSSPSTALAYLRRPDGRILMMDFLRAIVGPSNEEVRRLAVPVTIADQVTLHVLHPLLCLESRMANLEVIPGKRTGNGPMQAVWSVNIAAAYLQARLGSDSNDQLAAACRMIAEMAEFIASSTPVAVTRHGQTIGYFIQTHGHAEADVASLKKASKTLDRLLAAQSVDEDVVVAEFKTVRKRVSTSKKSKPVVA